MLKEFKIKTTKNQEIINITNKVKEIIFESGIKNGICVVYTSHTTVGILINENYDRNLCMDIINKLEQLVPKAEKYRHNGADDNAHSHIKASLIGPSKTIIIKDNKLILGTWQSVGLIEFDGPKERSVFVKIIGG